jgi:hypothetical protein
VQTLFGLDGAQVRLEHHVEVAGLGPLPLGAAVGADDVGHRDRLRVVDTLLLRVGLLQVILTVPLVTVQALDQRVVEDLDVTGGDPDLTGQDHRGVQADDVVAAGDDGAPPLLLDVFLELDTERAVIPRRLGTAVNLAAGVHESPALGEVDDGFDLLTGGVRLGGHDLLRLLLRSTGLQ